MICDVGQARTRVHAIACVCNDLHVWDAHMAQLFYWDGYPRHDAEYSA
jgi:hypothetical protein